ncbi:hypothetical protein P8625_00545 [Tenacibaculum tangerinum]|uniref:Uncharacterized protein n=1 Tax=Tenacibaculum tangerinum TaxID=3038772 RepID=A0ABY8L2M0_9FLAO|nr:hypothetical protein [Tenacibaculum tangerinum]WGH75684.1 hypothetical protein P8625_00545 [Tenacibaculum tangerinum]
MIKKILIIILIVPTITFAQKIKIKKEVITFDKKEVAKVNTDLRDNYLFSTLSGEKAFDVVFKGVSASNTEGFQWLEITSANGKKTEIPYEVLMTSFNSTKLIIKLLSAKYGLITSEGIDMDKVAAFFAEDREILSEKYTKIAIKAKEEQSKRQAKIGIYNPFVKDDGTILFGGSTGTKIMGYVFYGNNSYSIIDLDKILVGSATGCTTCTTVKVKTFTNEEFDYDYGSKTMMTGRFSRSFAQIFVEEMLGRNYKLGREAKTYYEKLHQEKIKIAKENSINLYGVPGYVIDKDGKKYSGLIYVIFEKLKLDPTQQENDLIDMNSIDKFGKFVSIKYKNNKGKLRTKRFAARNNILFGAIDNDVEKVFLGMKTKGNSFKKFSNATNLGFDNSYFYKIEYSNNENNMVLSKPGEPERFIVKLANNQVGFMIDNRSNDKLSKALSKYISDCKSLSENIKNQEFDLSNFENLKNIVDEYSTCK